MPQATSVAAKAAVWGRCRHRCCGFRGTIADGCIVDALAQRMACALCTRDISLTTLLKRGNDRETRNHASTRRPAHSSAGSWQIRTPHEWVGSSVQSCGVGAIQPRRSPVSKLGRRDRSAIRSRNRPAWNSVHRLPRTTRWSGRAQRRSRCRLPVLLLADLIFKNFPNKNSELP